MCKICASKCTETVLHNWLNMHEIIGASYKLLIVCFVPAPAPVSATCQGLCWVHGQTPHLDTQTTQPWGRGNHRGQLLIQNHSPHQPPNPTPRFSPSPALGVAKVLFRGVQQERYRRGALPTNFYCNRVEFTPAGFLQMQIGQPKILHSRLSRIWKAESVSAYNSISWGSTSLAVVEKIMKNLRDVHSSQQLSLSYS